jgi:hypothetical protein
LLNADILSEIQHIVLSAEAKAHQQFTTPDSQGDAGWPGKIRLGQASAHAGRGAQ